jgi:predicted O-linked N-acetylglucosamine transferase (SPINDLY family)
MSNYETILAQFQAAQKCHAQGDFSGALGHYDAILLAKPDLEEVHANKGVVLRDLRRFEEALACFNRAIEINPDLAEAYCNKGFVLTELGQLTEALANLDHAIRLKPDLPDAHNNRGVTLRRLNRLAEALKSYDRAIALYPMYGEAWSNRGEAYATLQQLDVATENFERALSLMPGHVDTLLNCALAFQKKRRFREAALLLNRVSQIDPTHKLLLFRLAYGALQHCDWSMQDVVRPRLQVECPTGKSIVAPLALLGYLDDPEALRQSSARYLKDLLGPTAFALERPAQLSHDKIRIAYLSGDFHEHATAYLMADLIERHDRSRFEVHGISLNPSDQSEMHKRLRRAFDQFHDVHSWSDPEVADFVGRLEVDIAIDLKGFTSGERPGIFTRRAAPIQVNYLGYPGTMANDCWDYIIADATVLPRVEQPFYAEKIVHLDCCYQPNDPGRHVAAAPRRASQGLPEAGFIFCCFNNHSKITRPIFDIWMRLLHAVPNSVLWLLDGPASDTLQSEAHARGVDSRRLVFAPLVSQSDHLARLCLADLVIDTLPYNAHTTASDALWAGVPIVTCRGKSFAGRVAGSLLTAIGLPELITENLAAYEALALKLALNEVRFASVRQKLSANKHTTPLFDADNFRANIERAYSIMMEKARRNEAPAGFDVDL